MIGTRGSALALWQAEHVAVRLQEIAPDVDVHVKRINTQGDLVRDKALWQVEGRGFFVKELENALLNGEADLAVHSLKDVPTVLHNGLVLGAVLERGDPRDALVARDGRGTLVDLPEGARVGTSSLRRRAQLLAARPDLRVADMRGNVDTRLRNLRQGQYDAVVLAVAGMVRLGLEAHITQILPIDVMLPAPAQGALAIECRADDGPVLDLLLSFHHRSTWSAVTAERAFLQGLSSGCSAPVGALATDLEQSQTATLKLHGLVATLDGGHVVRVSGEGPPADPEELGGRLAEQALKAGASEILELVL